MHSPAEYRTSGYRRGHTHFEDEAIVQPSDGRLDDVLIGRNLEGLVLDRRVSLRIRTLASQRRRVRDRSPAQPCRIDRPGRGCSLVGGGIDHYESKGSQAAEPGLGTGGPIEPFRVPEQRGIHKSYDLGSLDLESDGSDERIPYCN